MAFSSLLFVFGFLPAFLFVYYLTPGRFKNLVALLGSCLFYSWGAANVFGILLVGLLIDYLLANAIDTLAPSDERSVQLRKVLLGTSIAVNVGALAYYKYSNFFVAQLSAALEASGFSALRWSAVLLPIGISFFTFHKVSYVVDVYRKTSPRAKNFINYALYVLFFPQLIAGPIIRYHDVAEQFVSRRHTASGVGYGAFRFCIGLGKKVLLANQLAVTADLAFHLRPPELSSFHAWLGILCYTFQIYCDFSGYSDMALGLGQMLGIRFRENFDCPYQSQSVTEFWRRWHISLSTWMKEYLYVPLGGNRVSPARTYLNLWLVFLISGLWHGANWTFLIWGAYHGTFLVLEKLFALRLCARWPKLLRVGCTFLVVSFGWVFFRAPDVHYAFSYIGRLLALTPHVRTSLTPLTGELLTHRAQLSLALSALLSFLPVSRYGALVAKQFELGPRGPWTTGLNYGCALACLLLSCASLANSGYNPFIYFRF